MTPLKFRQFVIAGLGAWLALATATPGADIPVAPARPAINMPPPKYSPRPPSTLANPRWSPLYDYDSLDVKPRPIKQEPPLFPPGLKEKGVKATVMVEFIIGKQGNVEAAQVLSTTDSRFNDACVAAALKWRFTIPKKRNAAVFCRAAQNLSFD